jgi:hypothetical protein
MIRRFCFINFIVAVRWQMIFIVRLDFAGVKNESLLASVVRIERPWTIVWVAPFLKIGL